MRTTISTRDDNTDMTPRPDAHTLGGAPGGGVRIGILGGSISRGGGARNESSGGYAERLAEEAKRETAEREEEPTQASKEDADEEDEDDA